MIRPHTHDFTVHDDWRAIMGRDVALGVRGVRTSGGAARAAEAAAEAAARLAAWQRRLGDTLTIIAGGGVRAPTVAPLRDAGLRALHAAATDPAAFAALAAVVRESSREHADSVG
jgi:copper homeostasis protein CutC